MCVHEHILYVKVPMPAHRFKTSDWYIHYILLACVADVL